MTRVSPTPAITPAESRIMDALWTRGPLTGEAIRDAVAERGWGPATVRTLIGRLRGRGAIRSERCDGRVRYAPLLARADYRLAETRALVNRLFEGRLSVLVAHVAEAGELAPAEARRIRKLLKKLED